MFPTSSSPLSVAGVSFDASVSVGFSDPGFAFSSSRFTSVPLLFSVPTLSTSSLSTLVRAPASASLFAVVASCAKTGAAPKITAPITTEAAPTVNFRIPYRCFRSKCL